MATFGNTDIEVGTDSNYADTKVANMHALTEDGGISKLSVYLANTADGHGACHIKGVIYTYDDGDSKPSTILATGTEVDIGDDQAAGWVDLPFASTVHLDDANLFIGFIGDADCDGLTCYMDKAAGSCAIRADTYSDGASDPFGTVDLRAWQYSLYATYTSDAGAPEVFYVAKTGNDTTGDGSIGDPWLTIQKASDETTGGQVVTVGAGTYDERVTIVAASSGTSGDHTVFQANGAVIVAQGFVIQSDYTELIGFEITPADDVAIEDVDYRGVIYVQGSYVTLQTLDIHDTERASAICLLHTESNITIDGCTIDTVEYSGISTTNGNSGDHASHVTVSDCTMKNWGGEAAIKVYGDDWVVEDCEIQGITAGNLSDECDGDGIRINYSADSIIRRCRIYDIWPYYGYEAGQHADCIQLWVGVTNLLIESCVIGSWKPGGNDLAPGPTNALMFGTCQDNCDVIVQNCLIMAGIAIGPGYDAASHSGALAAGAGLTIETQFLNNTFFGNYADLGIGGGGTSGGQVVENNVFYSHKQTGFDDGRTGDYNAYLWMEHSEVGHAHLHASTYPLYEGAHSLGQTIETKLVAADIFVNPDMTVTTNYGLSADFKPKTGSVLIAAGNPAYAPAYDITGKARSNPPCIGAYEYDYEEPEPPIESSGVPGGPEFTSPTYIKIGDLNIPVMG